MKYTTTDLTKGDNSPLIPNEDRSNENSTFDVWWAIFLYYCYPSGVIINVFDPGDYREVYYDQGYTVLTAFQTEVESMEE